MAGRAAIGRAVEVARTAVPNQAGEAARAVALQGLGRLKVNLRLSAGNIGASVVGLFAVISVFIPWIAFAASDGRELETSEGFTLLEVASEAEVGVVKLFFFILLALGVVGLASVVLPRWAGLITGIVGMAMTLLTFIYIFVVVDEEVRELGRYGVTVVTIPYIGFFLTGGSFLLITMLRAVSGLNRTMGQRRDND